MKAIFKDILSQYEELKKQAVADVDDFKVFNEKLLSLSYLLHGPLKNDFFQEVPIESSYLEVISKGKKALNSGFKFEIDKNAQMVIFSPDEKKLKTKMIHPENLAAEISPDFTLNENQKKLLELFCANLEEYPMLLFSLRVTEEFLEKQI